MTIKNILPGGSMFEISMLVLFDTMIMPLAERALLPIRILHGMQIWNKEKNMNFRNCDGGLVADRIIQVIIENKQRLTDIDGAIGDGDHGINMSKGMHVAEEALKDTTYGMSKGLQVIQEALMNKIGGSMGPLYGMVFKGFVDASKKRMSLPGGSENMLEKVEKPSNHNRCCRRG